MIQLLPDHIANQIAAGEVVQRPASALKELLENAVDAGATEVSVILSDAGRTLLQVVDNGSGMGDTDARMAFERHATSKIKRVEDLNAIATFGFRGEALASIAAVAEVEVKTRRKDDETGTHLIIAGSEVLLQEPVACAPGTSIAIRNLFFNVPARRRFLKSDSVELKHLIAEIQRVALCHPEVAIRVRHNDTELYNLSAANLRQRIVHWMGKEINQQLLDLQVNTSVVRIKGLIGKPENAKRTIGDQFFFVNNRFFKSPYFQKAVFNGYQRLLPDKTYPAFFIYFELPPDKVDVNIHPAKIEIKFEDEQVIFHMLQSAVREALGKFAIVPSIDFDREGAPEMPVINRNTPAVPPPQVEIDPFYNPFEEEKKSIDHPAHFSPSSPRGWRKLYDGLSQNEDFYETAPPAEQPVQLSVENLTAERPVLQLKGKYILTAVKSGLMMIHRRRAQQRILYERFLQNMENHLHESQQTIFPQTVTLSPLNYTLLESILPELNSMGYDIRPFGSHAVVINGQPATAPAVDAAQLLEELLQALHENDLKIERKENVARMLATAATGKANEPLNHFEIQAFIDQLFACREPAVSPEGKPTLQIISLDEIDKRF